MLHGHNLVILRRRGVEGRRLLHTQQRSELLDRLTSDKPLVLLLGLLLATMRLDFVRPKEFLVVAGLSMGGTSLFFSRTDLLLLLLEFPVELLAPFAIALFDVGGFARVPTGLIGGETRGGAPI